MPFLPLEGSSRPAARGKLRTWQAPKQPAPEIYIQTWICKVSIYLLETQISLVHQQDESLSPENSKEAGSRGERHGAEPVSPGPPDPAWLGEDRPSLPPRTPCRPDATLCPTAPYSGDPEPRSQDEPRKQGDRAKGKARARRGGPTDVRPAPPSQGTGEVAVHTATIKWTFRSTGLDLGFLISILSPRQGTGCQTQRSSQRHQGVSSPVSQVRNLSSQPESACRSLRLVRGGGGIPTRPSSCKKNKEAATQATQHDSPQSLICQLTPVRGSLRTSTVLSAVCATTLRVSPRTIGGRGCPTPLDRLGNS